MKTRSLLAILTIFAAPVWAQSINIDLGPIGTEPPPDYRAAGVPGHWNKFPATANCN